jgi:hypothetical protein
MKKKTITSKFRPRRKKPQPWSFGKKTKNKNSTTLGALETLEKTMKENVTTLGALEKSKKKETMAFKVWPKRRRWLWELWKKP